MKKLPDLPWFQVDNFFDMPLCQDKFVRSIIKKSRKHALDWISYKSQYINGFHRDTLKIPSEFCFVFRSTIYNLKYNSGLHLTEDELAKIGRWATVECKCKFFAPPDILKPHEREIFTTVWNVYDTKAEAMIKAAVLGYEQPQVFNRESEFPYYVNSLIDTNCCYSNTAIRIYRLMVLDGVMQPIKKFMKKKNKKVA